MARWRWPLFVLSVALFIGSAAIIAVHYVKSFSEPQMALALKGYHDAMMKAWGRPSFCTGPGPVDRIRNGLIKELFVCSASLVSDASGFFTGFFVKKDWTRARSRLIVGGIFVVMMVLMAILYFRFPLF